MLICFPGCGMGPLRRQDSPSKPAPWPCADVRKLGIRISRCDPQFGCISVKLLLLSGTQFPYPGQLKVVDGAQEGFSETRTPLGFVFHELLSLNRSFQRLPQDLMLTLSLSSHLPFLFPSHPALGHGI